MGGQLYKSLHALGVTVTVIDPELKEGELECGIVGPVTQGNLIRAGVRDAVGTRHARRQLDSMLHNIDILEFLLTGEHPKTSYLMDWMRRRLRDAHSTQATTKNRHPGG